MADNQTLSVIGRAFPKIEALQKTTGEARYADDLSLSRMLYARILRCRHPHARILQIDTSIAVALPGVFAVITGADLPIKYGVMPSTQDEEALCTERARFVGDPVAAVAAVDEETAARALALIQVEYEPLEPILSISQALDEKRPQLHTYAARHNVHKLISLEFGDVAAGFRAADYVREDLFYYEGNTHLPLEEHSALASYSSDGRLTLWSSTQTPHYVHRALEKTLDIPRPFIRVVAPSVGGGFGGKADPFAHEIIVSKLSMLTGRPVKITLTREEVFYTHRGRHPTLVWVKSGAKQDGQITALHFKTILDGGAYGSFGIASTYYSGALQTLTYKIPAYKFEGSRVFTNKPPCGPKRGHGAPQPRFAFEVHLDKIAHHLGLDPADMRRRYVVDSNTKTVNHLTITSCGLRECIDAVTKASDWREWRGSRGNKPSSPRLAHSGVYRGLGLACSSYLSGAGLPIYWNDMPHSGVVAQVDRGGGVTIFCGSTDIGQGSNSLLAYIAAEELGLNPAAIRVHTADTEITPVDLGSYSSRVTVMSGNACIQAVRGVKGKILQAAAAKLHVPEASLVMRGGWVECEDDRNRRISFVEAVNLAEAKFGTLSTVGSYTPPTHAGPYKGSGAGPSPSYSYTACVAAVAVDSETGMVSVDKLWLAHDAGRVINPVIVRGQLEGCAYMGLAETLLEEQVFRKGYHKGPSMLDYKSPTFVDTPEIEAVLVETVDPEGPYGAKEAGEGPLLPVAPAIANAVFDAIGVRIDEIPLTPDKVLKALDEMAKGKEPRYGPRAFPEVRFPDPIHVDVPIGAPKLEMT